MWLSCIWMKPILCWTNAFTSDNLVHGEHDNHTLNSIQKVAIFSSMDYNGAHFQKQQVESWKMIAEGIEWNKYCLTYQPTKKYGGESKMQPGMIGITNSTIDNVNYIATLKLAEKKKKKKTYEDGSWTWTTWYPYQGPCYNKTFHVIIHMIKSPMTCHLTTI